MNFDPNEANLLIRALPLSTRQNLLDPSAKTIGEGMDGIFSTIFYPFIKLRIYNHSKLNTYANNIGNNLSKIPMKDRSTKKLDTTLKIMSNSKYCINNKVLRLWFAKLLASSVDSRVNNIVSNYFPTVLSNMDTGSAAFLTKFKNNSDFPIGNLEIQGNTKLSTVTFKHDIIDWNWRHPSNVFTFMSCEREINNIINVTFNSWLSGKKADKAYSTIKHCYSLKGKIKVGNSLRDVQIQKGIIHLTPLGKEFVKVTVP